MDRVRLGRVLGRGARQAARTVFDAVEAARSPESGGRESTGPRPGHPRSGGSFPSRSGAPSATPTHTVRVAQTHTDTVHGALRGAARLPASARAARQGLLAPVKRASRAVSLEIAGSFFALFALSFAAAAWRFRGALRGSAAQRLWIYLGFAALFGYFAISSFLRARRISRD